MTKEKGFTLVEILVVVSIILISVGIAGDMIISIIRTYNKTRILNEIEQNGNYVISKMSYDLKNAVSVTGPSNPCGAVLAPSMVITDKNFNSITYTLGSNISESGGSCSPPNCTSSILRRVNSGASEPMINHDLEEGVAVDTSRLYGFCFAGTSPDFVRIQFTLEQGPKAPGGKANLATQAFDTVIGLRYAD